jgi:hypothetical protein
VTAALAATVAWAPLKGSQTLFVTSPVYETLYEGTRGASKTLGLLIDFCQHVGQGYGSAWRGVLFRQNYPALADVVEKANEWIPLAFPDATFTQSGPNGYSWGFATGETLLFRYIDQPKDYRNYHGHEYPWLAFDELTNWPDARCYNLMQSCCRSSVAGLPRKLRATTNSFGPGFQWVKARFIDPAARGVVMTDARGNRRVAIHGHWSENTHLLDADPAYIDRLRAATEDDKDQQAAWVDGSWDIVAGSFFGDAWDRTVHVLLPFALPTSWRLDRAFDWGSAKPFSVGWWAECDGTPATMADGTQRTFPRGTLIRVGEWYGMKPGKPNVGLGLEGKVIAAGILERQHLRWPGRHVHPGPADSSIFDVQDGHCIAEGFAKAGVTWLPANKGPGSRKNGWQLMRDRLSAAKPKRDAAGQPLPLEAPGLFVFAGCRDFIRTVPALPRAEKTPPDVDTDAEDHAGDEARYRVLAPASPGLAFSTVRI